MEYYLISLYKFSGACGACLAFTVLHLNLSALRHCYIENKYDDIPSQRANRRHLSRMALVFLVAINAWLNARLEALFNIGKFHHSGSDANTVKAHIADNICG